MPSNLKPAASPRQSLVRLLARGLRRRCPRCGEGTLFRKWLWIVERCPRCGLIFEREEGGWLGSVVVNLGASQLVVVTYLAVSLALTLPHPPVVALIVGGVLLVTAFAVWFNPYSKTTWVAIELWMRQAQREDTDDVERRR